MYKDYDRVLPLAFMCFAVMFPERLRESDQGLQDCRGFLLLLFVYVCECVCVCVCMYVVKVTGTRII
jgi:hypothetical protein